MGCLKPCLSVSGDSVEIAVLELYDEPAARATPPGFDDVLGEPFLEDGDGDGVGERVRPGVVVEVLAKVDFRRYEEQVQDGTGNVPEGDATLTVTESELAKKGLLVAGVIGVRANDRLLRIKSRSGSVRVDLLHGGREGLHVVEVRPSETGSGVVKIVLEDRRATL